MAISHDPIDHLVRTVDSRGSTPRGRARLTGWASSQPTLAEWATPGEVAAACRAASFAVQDRVVAALVSVAAVDDLAQLTVVAGLSARLARIVSGWLRAGAGSWERPGLTVELLSECWALTAAVAGSVAAGTPVPARLGSVLVDGARERVRVPRRRERRRAARVVPLPDVLAGGPEMPAAEALAGEITTAVREGRLSVPAARGVFLTRVAGYPTIEAAALLGCSAASLRVARSRAERRLAA